MMFVFLMTQTNNSNYINMVPGRSIEALKFRCFIFFLFFYMPSLHSIGVAPVLLSVRC